MIHPVILYAGLAVGGIGVAMAMPRPRVNPQVLGALLAAIGFGAIFLALGLAAHRQDALPNLNFYLFALIALGSGLRVISHPRPVYAALYFILTILSSSALYLLAGAEFMAFALVIIYAGAILITYLFVIMLATQAPSEEDIGALSPYDAHAREPMIAAGTGFALLALLSGMFATGISTLQPNQAAAVGPALIAALPGKIERELHGEGLRGFELAEPTMEEVVRVSDNTALIRVTDPPAWNRSIETADVERLFPGGFDPSLSVHRVIIPAAAQPTNIDGVGWWLIAEHPMALELAGVILLMAMLGAVVLARKQIEIGEAEKHSHAQALSSGAGGNS